MPRLALDIECGERTCAVTRGVFCRFLGSVKCGQVPVCRLFPSDDHTYTLLDDVDGWVQRCEECLCAEGLSQDAPRD